MNEEREDKISAEKVFFYINAITRNEWSWIWNENFPDFFFYVHRQVFLSASTWMHIWLFSRKISHKLQLTVCQADSFPTNFNYLYKVHLKFAKNMLCNPENKVRSKCVCVCSFNRLYSLISWATPRFMANFIVDKLHRIHFDEKSGELERVT